MGDFDKNQPAEAPANAKRKQILVGILGATLLAVVAFHFLKGSPETAVASVSGGGNDSAQPARPARSATEELQDLANDPTANLLVRASALDPAWSDPPHDPFVLSERFRAKSTAPLVDPTPVVAHPTQPEVKAPEIPANSLKIEGIFRVGSKLQAIVDGNIVTAGATVGDAVIVDIKIDRVIVRHKDWPDGPMTTINLQSKMK